MSLSAALKLNLSRKSKASDELKKDPDTWKVYSEWKGSQSSSYSIPKFYYKVPFEEDNLQQKLREEARAVFLERKNRELLDNEDLKKPCLWLIYLHKEDVCLFTFNSVTKLSTILFWVLEKDEKKGRHPLKKKKLQILVHTYYDDYLDISPKLATFDLWMLLEQNLSPPFTTQDHMTNYTDFKIVASKSDEKFRPYFSARIFAKLLQNDPDGRISIRHFFNYVMRKVWLHQTRIGLSLYDVAGQGYLREVDLENYILELIPTLPQLDGLETSFHSFYVCTAVRKFFFFLDPFRTNKVKIQDILACSFLDDLLELRDETLPKDVQEANWFSAPSALRVYGQYLNLDTDHNGMLSKEELSRYGTGTLTPVFIQRVFQECLTYDREMDYKTYLDFVLALENRKEPQALMYFFRLLDIEQKNYLTVFDFNYFFRAIQEQMKEHGQEPVSFEDVKDEIFDMINPADPLKVTLQDLILCGQGDTIVSIVIDLNGFWTYENREVLVADTNEEAEV